MRFAALKSSCFIMAITLATSACAPSPPPQTVPPKAAELTGAQQVAMRDDTQDKLRASEAKARAAEQRAAAAQAKLECEKDRQQASNRGAVVGGVAGAILGTQVAGNGAKSEGGALGAVGGVLAGRQLAKKDHRC